MGLFDLFVWYRVWIEVIEKGHSMKRQILLFLVFGLPFIACGQNSPLQLSLEEALQMAYSNNHSILIAREGVVAAKAESRELRSLWYPSMVITGEYTHTLTDIAAVTSVGEIGSELLGNLTPIITNNPQLAELADGIANSQLRLPLVPRNTASVGAELMWTVFSGGRRIMASKIAKEVSNIAGEQYGATKQNVVREVLTAYMGVELAQRLVDVRKSALLQHSEHLRQARRLEDEGMINRAERLVAEVAYKQSATLLTTAQNDLSIAQRALSVLIGCEGEQFIPTTPLSIPTTIPSKEELLATIDSTPSLSMLRSQEQIANSVLNAEWSRYLPSVAVIGHQQLWSKGLDKNLFPRTIVGVGLSWTLFDGLSREGAISRSKASLHIAEITINKTRSDLQTAIERYYDIVTSSIVELEAQQTTISLAEEIVRVRRKAFAEGMATSSEVVDATQMLSEARVAHLATLYTTNTSLAMLLMLSGRAEEISYFIQ